MFIDGAVTVVIDTGPHTVWGISTVAEVCVYGRRWRDRDLLAFVGSDTV